MCPECWKRRSERPVFFRPRSDGTSVDLAVSSRIVSCPRWILKRTTLLSNKWPAARSFSLERGEMILWEMCKYDLIRGWCENIERDYNWWVTAPAENDSSALLMLYPSNYVITITRMSAYSLIVISINIWVNPQPQHSLINERVRLMFWHEDEYEALM